MTRDTRNTSMLMMIWLLLSALAAAQTTVRPTLSNIVVASSTSTTATITWTTNVGSSSQCYYGFDDTYGHYTTETDTAIPVTSHSCTITGWNPAGLYAGNSYVGGVISRGFTSGVPDPLKFANLGELAFSAAAPPTGSQIIAAEVRGGHHVVQGFSLYLNIAPHRQQGTSAGVTIVSSSLPPSSTFGCPDQQSGQDGGTCNPDTLTQTLTDPHSTQVTITPSLSTTPGTYTVKFHITSGTATAVDETWDVIVDAAPSFTPGTPSSYPAIPSLAAWQSNMTTYGTAWCAQDGNSPRTIRATTAPSCGIGAENCSWYYDGIWVYQRIDAYIGASTYNQCVANTKLFYRDNYILTQSPQGGVSGHRIFANGLQTDWLNNADATSKNAVDLMALHAEFSTMTLGSIIDAIHAREAAYKLDVNRIAVDLGYSQQTLVDRAIAYDLADIDQWVNYGNVNQPFYAGLLMEALIYYYQDGHQADTRIPVAVKQLADWLWTNAWIPPDGTSHIGTGTFYYNSMFYALGIDQTFAGKQGIAGASDMRDLNLLIAPAYAWLFQLTGDSTYQTEGDAIFTQGVQHASISQTGKTFAQNYRWSFDYVKWRTGLAAASGAAGSNSGSLTIGGTLIVH